MKNRSFVDSGWALSLLLAGLLSFQPGISVSEEAPVQTANTLSQAFQQVAGKITPSVVNISAIKKAKPGKPSQKVPDPFFDPFRDFFGDDLFDRYGQGQEQPQQGLGTGVIVSKDGYILTNNHVVGEADEVEVRLQNDQHTYKAEVKGTDARSDLAVIKISAPGSLTPATLGNSDDLKIGEWVIAAGNPFGLDNTITAGIVSAKGRSIMNSGAFEDFIQTDAAINPGNSGGPLVNLQGDVVGINTAIFSRSGGYMGIGFAIPSNMAKSVMDSLISKGRVIRGWLGVGIQNLTEDLAQSFNYKGLDGALVGQVQPDGPAEKAGFKQGDIIIKVGSTQIKNSKQLQGVISATAPGTSVNVEIVRNGATEVLSTKIGELPAQGGEVQRPEEPPVNIGLSVDTLTPELAARLGSRKKSGVVVTGVLPGSVAEKSGIQPRDIIISVNGEPVRSVKDFYDKVDIAALKKGLRLVLETQGMERFVFLRSRE